MRLDTTVSADEARDLTLTALAELGDVMRASRWSAPLQGPRRVEPAPSQAWFTNLAHEARNMLNVVIDSTSIVAQASATLTSFLEFELRSCVTTTRWWACACATR
jgi:hypothetical protein